MWRHVRESMKMAMWSPKYGSGGHSATATTAKRTKSLLVIPKASACALKPSASSGVSIT